MRFEHWLYSLPLKWRSLFRRADVEQDLDDELRYHLETEVEDLVARGMSRDEAWHAVRRRFGNIELSKEQCRDARGLNVLSDLAHDIRYALRMLRRQPSFTIVAVLTLALGIGANTAVFSLVDGILLARLPYGAPNQLVSVKVTYPQGGFVAMRDELRTLDVAAYAEGKELTLRDGGRPTQVTGARVSAELASLLDVAPQAGRWFRRGEDIAPADRFVVLSHGFWMARYRADPSIVGRFIELDGMSREVLGVMPETFQFPSARTDVWIPLGVTPRDTTAYWAGDFMPVIGRLRGTVSHEQARADVEAFQSRIVDRFPWRMPANWNREIAVVSLRDAVVGDVRTRLLIFAAAAFLILAIACANVANLSLSRAASRLREIGIRTAIGASSGRLARQLLTESVVLAALGGLAGVLLASPALALLKMVLPADTPRVLEADVDVRALGFTATISIVTGCVCGLAPVVGAFRMRLRTVLDSGGRGGGYAVAGVVRSTLAIAQVACAVLLVITAGLLVRSVWTLSRVDPGFRVDGIVTTRISPGAATCEPQERCLTFYRELTEAIATTPEVSAAGFVNTLPLGGSVAKRSLVIDGYTVPATQSAPLFWLHVVTPGYFETMELKMVSGRAFTRADEHGPAVAIVSADTARRFWDGRDPVGQRVRFVGESTWRTIVGVAREVQGYTLTQSLPEWMVGAVYVPLGANATLEDGRVPTDMTLVARTPVSAEQVEGTIRRLVGSRSRDVVVGGAQSMQSVLANLVAAPMATTSLLVAMAVLALVLGCVGVYGVLSFLVSRQTRDLGIRLALGAQRRDIVWMVLREGATLCVSGMIVGASGAFAVTRWLSSELHGVSPADPLTYVSVVLLTSLVSLLACYAPARRAMGVDPLIVFRDQ